MNSLRQVGSGLLYALVSVVLVVGGLSLALAEGRVPPPAPSAPPSPTLLAPSSTPQATESPQPVASPSPEVSSATVPPAASATMQPIIITATLQLTYPTLIPSPRSTSTRVYRPATAVPCGPYAGWVLRYTVQAGDTLYHIATQYRTTVSALQTANCKPSTVIFPGERLWVPNVPTITPGVTLIPVFPTNTPYPTEPLTLTPEIVVPTDTSNPDP